MNIISLIECNIHMEFDSEYIVLLYLKITIAYLIKVYFILNTNEYIFLL